MWLMRSCTSGALMQSPDLEGLEVGDDGFAFVGGE